LSMPMSKMRDTKYSYADYLQWDDEQRWELIDGIPYNMSPAPTFTHQRVSVSISSFFYHYLTGKSCEVLTAPFDVRLSEQEQNQETWNVVQPDISIICDPHKMDERGCKGAPDLVVEILSLGTAVKRDRGDKFRLYEKYGVREYWIVDPIYETIEVYLWQENRFAEQQVYAKGDVIQVSIFADCQMNLHDVFHRTFPVDDEREERIATRTPPGI
jgi:Uma2 family endonuclease